MDRNNEIGLQWFIHAFLSIGAGVREDKFFFNCANTYRTKNFLHFFITLEKLNGLGAKKVNWTNQQKDL